jgi:hypothetical protein
MLKLVQNLPKQFKFSENYQIPVNIGMCSYTGRVSEVSGETLEISAEEKYRCRKWDPDEIPLVVHFANFSLNFGDKFCDRKKRTIRASPLGSSNGFGAWEQKNLALSTSQS